MKIKKILKINKIKNLIKPLNLKLTNFNSLKYKKTKLLLKNNKSKNQKTIKYLIY